MATAFGQVRLERTRPSHDSAPALRGYGHGDGARSGPSRSNTSLARQRTRAARIRDTATALEQVRLERTRPFPRRRTRAARIRDTATALEQVRLVRTRPSRSNRSVSFEQVRLATRGACRYRVLEARPGSPSSPARSRQHGKLGAQTFGCTSSTQRTSSGGSLVGISRFTTIGSCPLRTTTHSRPSSPLAFISWCGTNGGT
jgi:hypothetical protein